MEVSDVLQDAERVEPDRSAALGAMKRTLLTIVSSLFSTSDEDAMLRVKEADDAHAFAVLVRRWEVPIQRLCTRMVGDQHRGEDLTQDTFARVFAKRKEYQPNGKFSTFLWRVALNFCYDELRRQKRRPETSLEHLAIQEGENGFCAPDQGPDALLEEREQSELVRHAVLQLAESYRSVVVLRHYEDLKFREIAEVLGIPEGTVKSRMAEALTQLHKHLSHVCKHRPSLLCDTKRSVPSLVR